MDLTDFSEPQREVLARYMQAEWRGAYDNDEFLATPTRFHHARLEPPLAPTPAQLLRLHACAAFADDVAGWAWALIRAGMTSATDLSKQFTIERTLRPDWTKMPGDVGRFAVWHMLGLFLNYGDEAWEQRGSMPTPLGFADVLYDGSGIDRRRTGIRLTKAGWVRFDCSGIGSEDDYEADRKSRLRWALFDSYGDRILGVIVFYEGDQWRVIASFERLPVAQVVTPELREAIKTAASNEVLEAVWNLFRGTNAAYMTVVEIVAALDKAGLSLTKRELGLHLKRVGIDSKVAWINGKAVRVLHRDMLPLQIKS